MKKSKKILLKWAATYGEDESDVKASMYNEDMMIEFAKYYHKQKLTLTDVSQQRELLMSTLTSRVLTIQNEPDGIVRETMINNLLIDINCG